MYVTINCYSVPGYDDSTLTAVVVCEGSERFGNRVLVQISHATIAGARTIVMPL